MNKTETYNAIIENAESLIARGYCAPGPGEMDPAAFITATAEAASIVFSASAARRNRAMRNAETRLNRAIAAYRAELAA